jgi:hypothetical protein
MPNSLRPPTGSLRSQLAKVNEYNVTGLVDDLLSPDDQRVLWGASSAEMMAGSGGGYRRGYSTFAIEFGRWVDAAEPTPEAIREHLQEVASGIRAGRISFGDAAAHYRKNRLGAKAGGARPLAKHLARALDSYLSRFPATDKQTIRDAVQILATIADRRAEGESS